MSKKILYTAIAVFILMVSGCAQQQAGTEKIHPYPFQTAKIEFSLTGNMEGTRTVYIKGDKSVNETHTVRKDGEKEIKVNIKLLELGDTYYQVDLDTNTAVKTTNQLYESLKLLPADNRMNYLIRAATGNIAPGATEPVIKSQKEIAGQKCNVYDIQTFGEVCIWNGIALYSTIKVPEQNIENTTTATKIETDINVPDSVFELPADVEIQDTTSQEAQ